MYSKSGTAQYVDWISKVEFGVAEADRGTDKDPDVDGQNNLVDFDQGVTEVTPASGMPTINTGWSYRTFRLDGAVPARGAKGFLRVRVAPE